MSANIDRGRTMMRVLTARFMHETNTFSRVKTDMALIRRRDFHLENEIPQAFRGTRSAFGATFEAADKYGWSLVHPVSANPNPSGIVTDDAFETITGLILEAVAAKGPIDGALLHLHGAMVTEAYEDAEGELLARLWQRLGPQVPIRAKQLLAEAGYPDGFSMSMDCPNDRYVNDEAICTAIVAMLARVGVKVDLTAQT